MKIKVKYCALNPRDLLLLEGNIESKTPFIPGYEVAGEVVEKGKSEDEDENSVEVGDKVVALSKSYLGGLSSHCIAQEKVGFNPIVSGKWQGAGVRVRPWALIILPFLNGSSGRFDSLVHVWIVPNEAT